MGREKWSVRRQCLAILTLTLGTMAALVAVVYAVSREGAVLAVSALLMLAAFCGGAALTVFYGRALQAFTDALCTRLDAMLDGADAPLPLAGGDTLFDRLSHRLDKLYRVIRRQRAQAVTEREILQGLVSDIAHQVRLPVSNLRLLTDALSKDNLDKAAQADFLQELRAQVEGLDFLMQALVKTSRLETGLIQLRPVEARLADTVAQAVSGVVFAAEKKGQRLQVDCPDALTACHDPRWTAEALFNLLDNAVKYTPSGGTITIRVGAGEAYVQLAVADNGPGIAESEQARIFKRFVRGRAAQDQPGVGIGLSLARDIVQRQGGLLRLSSAPGEGAVFTIMLPRGGF